MLESLFNKKVREFNTDIKSAKRLLKEGKFSDAIEYYNLLNKCFNSIPKFKRTKEMKDDLKLIYKKLNLYTNINEAYILANNGNLSKLGEELKHIHDLIYNLKEDHHEDIPPLIKSTAKYYNFFANMYKFRVSKQNFIADYKILKNDLNNSNLAKAADKMHHLIIHYHNISTMLNKGEQLELYSMLKSLYNEYSIKYLLKKAHVRSSPIFYNMQSVDMPNNEKYIRIPELNINQPVQKFDGIYSEVRRLISNDKYFEAFEQYSNSLLNEPVPDHMLFSGFTVPKINIPNRKIILHRKAKISNFKFPEVYNNVAALIKKNKYYASFSKFEERLMNNFIPEGMLRSGFKRPSIQLPFHEKFIVLPIIKLDDVIMYSKDYNKIHKLVMKGKYADAVSFYEREIMHNYVPRDFLKENMEITKIDVPNHKNIIPEISIPETVFYSSEYHKAHRSLKYDKYNDAVSLFGGKYLNPPQKVKIDIKSHKVSVPVVVPQDTVKYTKEYSKMHEKIDNNKLFKKTSKILKIVIPNHKVQAREVVVSDVVVYPKEMSLVHKKLKSNDFVGAGLILGDPDLVKEANVKTVKLKSRKISIYHKINSIPVSNVKYPSEFSKIRSLLERGNYKKASLICKKL